jgi:excisionase family DNA binding protein
VRDVVPEGNSRPTGVRPILASGPQPPDSLRVIAVADRGQGHQDDDGDWLGEVQRGELRTRAIPYVIGLLESGQIPFRKVGRHRRVTFESLMAYKRQDDLQRRAAADELADLSQDLGLY